MTETIGRFKSEENGQSSRKAEALQKGVFTVEAQISDRQERLEPPSDTAQPEELETADEGPSTSQKCLVLLSCYVNVFVALGFVFSIGALYVEIIHVYSASRSQASLIQSLCLGVTFGGSFIIGLLINYFGVRVMVITGGLLGFLGLATSWFASSLLYLTITVGAVTGSGTAMIHLSSSVTVPAAFPRRQRLAMPGMACAAGAGGIMFPLLLEFLLGEYGLRGTLLIIGGVYLHTVPFGLLMTSRLGVSKLTRKRVDSKSKPLKEKFKFLKHPGCVVLLITSIFSFGTMNNFQVSILDFLESRGYPVSVGIQILLMYNSINTVTRLGSGFLKLLTGLHGAVIYCSSLILCASCLILLRSTSELNTIITFVALFAVGYGSFIGMFALTILEFVGLESFPLALGCSGLLTGIANPVGAVIMGSLYDWTKSYELSYLTYGIAGNSAAILVLLSVLYVKLRQSCGTKVHVIS